MPVQLYDLAAADESVRFSPHCWRARLALAHKGLNATTVPWRFTDTELIAFSGQKKVPVIVDGERVVSDSWAIAEYLETTYPDRPSLFGGPSGLALTRFVRHWIETAINPPILRLILLDLFAALHEADKPYFRESREARFGCTLEEFALAPEDGLPMLRKALEPLRRLLGEQAFVAGDAPMFADYVAFAPFQWARAVTPLALLEDADPVQLWEQRIMKRFDGIAAKAPCAR